MKVPVPHEMCERISARAVQLARENIQQRDWSEDSVQSLSTKASEGQVGIQTSLKYLIHQDRGIRPFVMYWAEGRTIPLPDGQGGIHFVRAKGVGTPGWVTLPGGVRKWREQRWRHPGLKPKNFMSNSLRRAIEESRPELQQLLMSALRGGIGVG